MSLNGNLHTISLPGILQLLCNEKKTGILRVYNEADEFQFFFYEGSIVYAIQAHKEARLGFLLKKAGLITDEHLKKCLEVAKQMKESLGKILISEGFIPEATLERFLFKQVEEIIFNLFQWGEGNFCYKDAQFNLRWMVVVKLNTLNLIFEALRRVDELQEASKKKVDIAANH